jgi:hypothetical protein
MSAEEGVNVPLYSVAPGIVASISAINWTAAPGDSYEMPEVARGMWE